MGFEVKKGNSFNIKKSISKVLVGVGWDVDSSSDMDLDIHLFGCVDNGGNPKFYNDGSHAVTYANDALQKNADKSFSTLDQSIRHTGDNRTGKGDGDDEVIEVDLAKIPAEITELSIFLTIYDAKAKKQFFKNVKNSFCRIVNQETGEELCRYSPENEFGDCVSLQLGSLVRSGSEWTFAAVGAGMQQEELGDILGALS